MLSSVQSFTNIFSNIELKWFRRPFFQLYLTCMTMTALLAVCLGSLSDLNNSFLHLKALIKEISVNVFNYPFLNYA